MSRLAAVASKKVLNHPPHIFPVVSVACQTCHVSFKVVPPAALAAAAAAATDVEP